MKILPAVWTLPLIAGLPTLWIIICKGCFETTAKLTLLGLKGNCAHMFFRQLCQFSFIACINFWVDDQIVKRFKLQPIFFNTFFYGIYFQIFGFGLFDFEYSRNNMQMVLPSLFAAYVGRFDGKDKLFSVPLNDIPTTDIEIDAALGVTLDTMRDQPTFWICTIVFVLLWIAFQIFIVYKYRSIIFPPIIKNGNCIKYREVDPLKYKNMVWIPKHPYKNPVVISAHILALVHIILKIEMYVSYPDFMLTKYSHIPYLESIFLAFSHFEKSLSSYTKEHLTEIMRGYLPPGRRWLDARPNPVYPAVHCDMQTFCAYNKGHKDCEGFVPPERKPLVKEIPNVVLIAVESLTPSHYLVSKDFISEHVNIGENDTRRLITTTKYYNRSLVPNFQDFEDYGVTFSGMSSYGIPTASGWNGLLSGLAPSQSFGNMIDGAYMHGDDIPSLMTRNGFRSFLVYPAMFNFDGAGNWVWRKPAEEEAKQILHCEDGFGDLIDDPMERNLFGKKKFPKLKKCSKEEVQKVANRLKKRNIDFPRWFDHAYQYMPSRANSKYVNIEPETLNEQTIWPADRITSYEFVAHFDQHYKFMKAHNISKPIFATHLSVDSHVPYNGYDKDEFYDDVIDKSVKKDAEQYREARFLRVSKYTDKYQIGYVLNWLKKNHPNTIFAITGDHGTRDIPIREEDSPLFDDVVYSSDCVHKSSGVDSFYVVSSVIGYLGDDPVVKEVMGLEELKGKTLKFPCDHGDLIYTLEDIVNKLNGTTMHATHRRNRNLLDMSLNISKRIEKEGLDKMYEYIDSMNWSSYSMTSYNTEYRNGTQLLRTHPADPDGSHYYEHVSYPTCLRKKSEKPMEVGVKRGLEVYDTMFRHIQAETHLMYNNRLYNYAFRDQECVEKGDCKYPEPVPLVFNDDFFVLCMFGICFITLIVLGVLPEVFFIAISSCRKTRIDEEQLNGEFHTSYSQNNLNEYENADYNAKNKNALI